MDRRTDLKKLIVAFRDYAKAPNNVVHFYDKPPMHIYEYFQSHIAILQQHISVSPNTIRMQIIIQKVL